MFSGQHLLPSLIIPRSVASSSEFQRHVCERSAILTHAAAVACQWSEMLGAPVKPFSPSGPCMLRQVGVDEAQVYCLQEAEGSRSGLQLQMSCFRHASNECSAMSAIACRKGKVNEQSTIVRSFLKLIPKRPHLAKTPQFMAFQHKAFSR